jgi:predicted nucleic acid-binding protein
MDTTDTERISRSQKARNLFVSAYRSHPAWDKGDQMIFIDSSVITRLLSDDESVKERTRILLESFVCTGRLLVTSTIIIYEILQEISEPSALWRFIDNALEYVVSVDVSTMKLAHWIVRDVPRAPLRVAIHVATLRQHGIGEVFTHDDDFDLFPEITRFGEEL